MKQQTNKPTIKELGIALKEFIIAALSIPVAPWVEAYEQKQRQAKKDAYWALYRSHKDAYYKLSKADASIYRHSLRRYLEVNFKEFKKEYHQSNGKDEILV